MENFFITEKQLSRIKRYRIIDDRFMRMIMEDNKPAVELFCNKIIGIKVNVEKVAMQEVLLAPHGKHSLQLDVLAKDIKGKIYNIEFQNAANGAIPKRARYHSSMIDVHNLDEGKDFKDLPETYVIFITATDVLKGGLAIYHVDRTIKEMSKDFFDGAHIIYVNSQIQDQTELGKLMHDLYCTSASDMYFEELAERVRYYKETKEGLRKMFSVEDEIREEGITIGIEKTKLEAVKNLMKTVNWTASEAMKNLGYSPEEQKQLMTML